MDEAGFVRFLKRLGKKEHVIDGLVGQVRAFEAYLAGERHKNVHAANADDLHAYVDARERAEPGGMRVRIRGLALYYEFTGNATLASLASQMREQRVARNRKPFRLKDFRGVDPGDLERLKAAGIVNADEMLRAGSTPQERKSLAERTGVAPEAILEYVKLSDLARLEGLKTVRARLYYDAGFDTLDKIAAQDPEELRAQMLTYVERTGFDGIAPLPREVRNAVRGARTLHRIVAYD